MPARAGSQVATVDPDDVLRDALSDLLQQRVHYGAVVDPAGRVLGVLSIELIQELLLTEGERAQAAVAARESD